MESRKPYSIDCRPLRDETEWIESIADTERARNAIIQGATEFGGLTEIQALVLSASWVRIAQVAMRAWRDTILAENHFRSGLAPSLPSTSEVVQSIEKQRSLDLSNELHHLRRPYTESIPRLYRLGCGAVYEEIEQVKELAVTSSLRPSRWVERSYHFEVSQLYFNALSVGDYSGVKTRLPRWFRPIASSKGFGCRKLGSHLFDAVSSSLEEVGDLKLDGFRSYLMSAYEEVLEIFEIHITRLLKRRDLPTHLIAGTGGSPWTAMLKAAVIATGGRVSGYDHSLGLGFASAPVVQSLVESVNSSEFVVPNSARAEAFRRGAKAAGIPKIVTRIHPLLRPIFGPNSEEVDPRIHRTSPRRILYVATKYWGNKSSLYATWSDTKYLAIQRGIISCLTSLDLKVKVRPHPECSVGIHPLIRDYVAADVQPQTLHSDIDWADVIVFDYFQTTAMGHALASSKAICFIDFGLTRFHPPALAMLRKRVAVLRVDSKPLQPFIDPSELQDSLKAGQELRDDSFIGAFVC